MGLGLVGQVAETAWLGWPRLGAGAAAGGDADGATLGSHYVQHVVGTLGWCEGRKASAPTGGHRRPSDWLGWGSQQAASEGIRRTIVRAGSGGQAHGVGDHGLQLGWGMTLGWREGHGDALGRGCRGLVGERRDRWPGWRVGLARPGASVGKEERGGAA
ncbi:hypothetical protein E2562_009127 [Oryza meyeriana var. granulata]|uniref:Uncharacterized protein n=1 Tax=Oryza meyeriana var. granulata TaxID=110450 RepID=A0A6G1D1F2_9ORYZ|nr:hypothetical protein E2562_009127 [Oryza meyeriana var. granulata]